MNRRQMLKSIATVVAASLVPKPTLPLAAFAERRFTTATEVALHYSNLYSETLNQYRGEIVREVTQANPLLANLYLQGRQMGKTAATKG